MNGTATGGSGKVGQYSSVARMALSHPVISLSNANSQSKSSVLQFGSHSRIYGSGGEIGKPGQKHWGKGGNRRASNDRGVLFRKDIFYRGSLYNIPEYKCVPNHLAKLLSIMTMLVDLAFRLCGRRFLFNSIVAVAVCL